MKNNSFTIKIVAVIIVLIVIAVILSYSNKAKNSSDSYTYENSKGNYSLQLPNGWGVDDTDSDGNSTYDFRAAPASTTKISDADFQTIDPKTTQLVSVLVSAPGTPDLEKNFTTLFEKSSPIRVANTSPDIKQIRRGILENGCKGFEYELLTNRSIYVVQACYPDDSKAVEMEDVVKNIVISLNEM